MPGLNTILTRVQTVTAGVPTIGTVHDYMPTIVTPADYPYAVVSISHVREERQGYGGGSGTGKKWIRYTVVAELWRTTHVPETDEALWRTLLDNVRVQWRANQTLSGDSLRFGETIDVDLSAPRIDGNTVYYHARVTSEALEEITA